LEGVAANSKNIINDFRWLSVPIGTLQCLLETEIKRPGVEVIFCFVFHPLSLLSHSILFILMVSIFLGKKSNLPQSRRFMGKMM
jgi:hypothetical protein